MRTTRSSARNAAAAKRDEASGPVTKAEPEETPWLSPITRYFGGDGIPRRFIRRPSASGSVKSLSSVSSIPDSDYEESDVEMVDDAETNPTSPSSAMDSGPEAKFDEVRISVEESTNRSSPILDSDATTNCQSMQQVEVELIVDNLKPDPDVPCAAPAHVAAAPIYDHEAPPPITRGQVLVTAPDENAQTIRSSSIIDIGDDIQDDLCVARAPEHITQRYSSGPLDEPVDADAPITFGSSPTMNPPAENCETCNEDQAGPSVVESLTTRVSSTATTSVDSSEHMNAEESFGAQDISTNRAKHNCPIQHFDLIPDRVSSPDVIIETETKTETTTLRAAPCPEIVDSDSRTGSPLLTSSTADVDAEIQSSIREEQCVQEDSDMKDNAEMQHVIDDNEESDSEMADAVPNDLNSQVPSGASSPRVAVAASAVADSASLYSMLEQRVGAEVTDTELDDISNGQCTIVPSSVHDCEGTVESKVSSVFGDRADVNTVESFRDIARQDSVNLFRSGTEGPEMEMCNHDHQNPGRSRSEPFRLDASDLYETSTVPQVGKAWSAGAQSPFERRVMTNQGGSSPRARQATPDSSSTVKMLDKPRLGEYLLPIFVPMDDGQEQRELPGTPISKTMAASSYMGEENPDSPLTELGSEIAQELEREICKEDVVERVSVTQPPKIPDDAEVVLDEIIVRTDWLPGEYVKLEGAQDAPSQPTSTKPRTKGTKSRTRTTRPVLSSSSVRTSSRQRKRPARLEVATLVAAYPPRNERRRVSKASQTKSTAAMPKVPSSSDSALPSDEPNSEQNSHGMSLRQRTSGPFKNSDRERAAIVWLYNHYKGDMKSVRNELPGSWGRGSQEKERLLRILGEVEEEGGIKLTPAHSEKARRLVGFADARLYSASKFHLSFLISSSISSTRTSAKGRSVWHMAHCIAFRRGSKPRILSSQNLGFVPRGEVVADRFGALDEFPGVVPHRVACLHCRVRVVYRVMEESGAGFRGVLEEVLSLFAAPEGLGSWWGGGAESPGPQLWRVEVWEVWSLKDCM
ncbi:hypothetical protein QBC44DRAFT_403211 [Cladorrhinum sp. PSN332]|nr:hypothetical protein QBC44DRAFT_403211 [Cladorrhinum sp. PSN332]